MVPSSSTVSSSAAISRGAEARNVAHFSRLRSDFSSFYGDCDAQKRNWFNIRGKISGIGTGSGEFAVANLMHHFPKAVGFSRFDESDRSLPVERRIRGLQPVFQRIAVCG